MLRALSRPLVRVAERWVPDALFFAIALSVVVAVLAFALTDVGPGELILGWGDGLAGLLAFMTQIVLVLLLGYTLAHTPAVQRLLRRFADLPRSPRVAYGFVALVAALAGLLSWGLGLIVGGVMAVEVARAARRRGVRLHYPLLVASGYSGYVLWHMGYSGSGPLAAATPGGIYEDLPGGLVEVSRTTFAPWNLAAIAVGLVVVTAAMMLLAPKGDDRIVEAPQTLLEPEEAPVGAKAERRDGPGAMTRDSASPEDTEEARPTPADRLDTARVVTLTLGIALGLFLVTHFGSRGFQLTLDIVNWSFLCVILLLVGNVRHFMALVTQGSRTVGGVLVQYPLYAGIIGMMTVSGLVTVFSDFFVDISSPGTLGVWGFLSAGLLNMFIPSGGGQFAVQAPIFAQSAAELGVDQSVVIMAIAYGDQWTNMIQPFWAVPLLAVAGLKVRDILGYTTVTLLVSGIVFAATLLLVGAG
ncbi:MAG TPA: TIGR00366 family protein [Actinomycetales bacterium]|nr:TIGR00366 family protein [Actinomycetales bacterium]